MNVIAGGELGQFSFSDLLVSLTSSLALLAVASTVVNLLAQFVLPLRAHYCYAMSECTPDFTDVDALQRLSLVDLQALYANRGKWEDL